MRPIIFVMLVFITVGLCLWLMPTGTEAYPYQRNTGRRCPPTCKIFCPCGYNLDAYNCPMCSCRASITCTGRHPNGYGRPPFVKSQIVY